MEDQDEKIKELLELVEFVESNSDKATSKEVAEVFAAFAGVLKELLEQIQEESQNLKEAGNRNVLRLKQEVEKGIARLSDFFETKQVSLGNRIREGDETVRAELLSKVEEVRRLVEKIQVIKGGKGDKGDDGSPDTPEQVRDKLFSLKDDKRLDAKAIKNLPEATNTIIRESFQVGAFETPIKDSSGVPLSKDASGAWKLPVIAPGTTWGTITGTLSSQTDLQAAFDAKQDDITLTTTGTSGAATFIGNTLNIPNYSTTPGGSDTQVQFNDGGSFGGDAGLVYNKTTDTLSAANISVSGKVLVANGSEAAPSYSFSNFPDTGLFLPNMGQMNVSFSGTSVFYFAGNQVGTLGGLDFLAQGTSGSYFLEGSTGSETNPTYAFTADTDTGMYRIGADTLGFTTGGVERVRMDSFGLTVGSLSGVLKGAAGLVSGSATTADLPDSINKRYVTDAQLVVIGNTSNVNTGDQASIVGITGTKAQFDTAVTDGNFLYVGDVTQYTDEMAQDAVGAMVNTSLTYVDGTPSLGLTSRTIGGVAFDGTANITVASATGGFTVSGGNLALGTNSLTLTGSIGATGARATKLWATDGEFTNMPTVGGTSLSSTFQGLDADLTSWAGVTRASGFDTFTATPSSANLASLVTGETGSGALVFANTPTLTTPIATSLELLNAGVNPPFKINGATTGAAYLFNSQTGSGQDRATFAVNAYYNGTSWSFPNAAVPSWAMQLRTNEDDFVVNRGAPGVAPSTTLFSITGSSGTAAFAGQVVLAASSTARSSLNIPAGTAPTAPADGDVWREDNTNTGLKIRVNGVTKTISLA